MNPTTPGKARVTIYFLSWHPYCFYVGRRQQRKTASRTMTKRQCLDLWLGSGLIPPDEERSATWHKAGHTLSLSTFRLGVGIACDFP